MPVLVALLRGVNVGGKTTLPMAELRRVAEDLGFDDVRTYIQSGNLLLRTSKAPRTVGRDLARGIAALGGVAPAVIVRTRDQLESVVASSPFPDADPAHLHVVFTDADRAAVDLPDVEAFAPERVKAVGPDVHLLLPGGVGRSKLAQALTKHGGATGTMRSWRTVTKLLELADELDGASRVGAS